MYIKEKEAIERQFERNLDLLVRKKFPLTATAIVAAEQPMILLFKELIHRIEKREFELDKKDKIIKYNQDEFNEAYALQIETIRKMADFLFHNYYKMTYVDEFQYEERIQEIIGNFEKKAEDN